VVLHGSWAWVTLVQGLVEPLDSSTVSGNRHWLGGTDLQEIMRVKRAITNMQPEPFENLHSYGNSEASRRSLSCP
jgi:hypothetical protein